MVNMSKNYYTYTHIDTSIDTVDELLTADMSIIQGYDKKEFLKFKNEDGVTNLDQIYNSYTETQKEDFKGDYSKSDLSVLNIGTVLFIPKGNLNNELVSIIGSNLFLEQKDYSLFMSQVLSDIQNDPLYRRTNTIKANANKYTIENLFNNCQIWVYIRALNKVIDVTPFITSANITVSVQGGVFGLTISPSTDIYNNFYSKEDVFNYSMISTIGELRDSWFMKNIQMNDIFFIKFETLQSERRINNFDIPKNELPNQIFDMIGLVDSIESTYMSQINEMIVNISGRDLSKLLSEDGSYFHPFAFVEGAQERFFINPGDDNRFFKRLFVSGQFKTLFTLGFKSISNALGFIFNQLTNTGVTTDNDLFSAYGDRRSKTYMINGVEEKDLKEVLQNGIYQIVDLLVDKRLDDRRVVNDGISNPDGLLIEQIYKICQEPFVEFWGDTIKDKFTFIARQPPFVGDEIKQYIENELVVEIYAERVSNISLSFSTEYYSWYQLKPENSHLGKGDYLFLSNFPAVLIPQYMDIFGNNRLIVSSNYISYQALSGKGERSNVNLFREAAVNDLIYLIESTIYLPFTRRGSITIKGGDRRIKKGNWVYFRPTDEYFYVTAVTNSIRVGRDDIDRETVITVERGMKREFIFGKTVDLNNFGASGKDLPMFTDQGNIKGSHRDGRKIFDKNLFEVSYFNIVKLNYVKKSLVDFSSGVEKSGNLESVVDNNVLNFFLYKLQFEDV